MTNTLGFARRRARIPRILAIIDLSDGDSEMNAYGLPRIADIAEAAEDAASEEENRIKLYEVAVGGLFILQMSFKPIMKDFKLKYQFIRQWCNSTVLVKKMEPEKVSDAKR